MLWDVLNTIYVEENEKRIRKTIDLKWKEKCKLKCVVRKSNIWCILIIICVIGVDNDDNIVGKSREINFIF